MLLVLYVQYLKRGNQPVKCSHCVHFHPLCDSAVSQPQPPVRFSPADIPTRKSHQVSNLKGVIFNIFRCTQNWSTALSKYSYNCFKKSHSWKPVRNRIILFQACQQTSLSVCQRRQSDLLCPKTSVDNTATLNRAGVLTLSYSVSWVFRCKLLQFFQRHLKRS